MLASELLKFGHLMVIVRKYLKEQTKSVHYRLHHHILLKQLISKNINKMEYFLILNLMRNFYSALSIKTEIYKEKAYFIKEHLASLEDDVKMLNADITLPPCNISMNPIDNDEFFGIAYVIRGSHIVSQIIYNNVSLRLNLKNNKGLSFFGIDQKKAKEIWEELLIELENKVISMEKAANIANELLESLESYATEVFAYFTSDINSKYMDIKYD